MRAVTFSRLGGPEVLEVSDLPEPKPGPGEVRIRVAAATVNPTDISFRSGRQLSTAQLAEMGVRPPYVPGMEFAGVVDAVGEGARWRQGERVMAIVNPRRPGGGAQAELVVVPSASVARVPEGTSLEAAATLPMNGLTVRLALDRLGLKPGQTLAVTGAAGGVGGLIDAAVLDGAALPAIRDGGKLATVRGFAGPSERGITIEPVRVLSYVENHDALDRLGRLVAEGRLTLRVAETFPPERAADAQRKLAAGGTRGRLLIAF
jgi:NADPH:quinone reductase-like Zn-dependent oxidoreductase